MAPVRLAVAVAVVELMQRRPFTHARTLFALRTETQTFAVVPAAGPVMDAVKSLPLCRTQICVALRKTKLDPAPKFVLKMAGLPAPYPATSTEMSQV